jgi:hypothetical protein
VNALNRGQKHEREKSFNFAMQCILTFQISPDAVAERVRWFAPSSSPCLLWWLAIHGQSREILVAFPASV